MFHQLRNEMTKVAYERLVKLDLEPVEVHWDIFALDTIVGRTDLVMTVAAEVFCASLVTYLVIHVELKNPSVVPVGSTDCYYYSWLADRFHEVEDCRYCGI